MDRDRAKGAALVDNVEGQRQSLFGIWPATRVNGEAMAGRRRG